jgi:hypothetical protein
VWFLDSVKMHALDTKWDVLNDKKNMLTIGATFGTIMVDITQMRAEANQVRRVPVSSSAGGAKQSVPPYRPREDEIAHPADT